MLGEHLDACNAGFFAQLSESGNAGRLKRLDTALGHLPDMSGVIASPLRLAPSNPHLALRVEQHDART
jgi:hypothetical protein